MRSATTVLEIIHPATKAFTTAEAPHGRHDEHWRAGCHGNRARPVREGVGKGAPTESHLAGDLLHFKSGSARAGRCDSARLLTRWYGASPPLHTLTLPPVRSSHNENGDFKEETSGAEP